MEMDELQSIWLRHEQQLMKSTRINRELFRKLLVTNSEKRIDWLKLRMLGGLILPVPLLIFVAIPNIELTFTLDVILGLVLFVPLFVISYIWAIRLYLLVEQINFNETVLSVSRQLRLVEKYKLRIKKYGLILAPFMVIGIFLSAGISFLSAKMIPFYVLMVLVFLISSYVRSKHGLVAQIRKIDRDLEEILQLEQDKN